MSDLVTVSEAARELGLNKSTVSRQIGRLGVAKDPAGRFSLEAYRAARRHSLNPMLARNRDDAPAAAPVDGAEPAEPAPAGKPGRLNGTGGSGNGRAAGAGLYADANAEHKAWQARKAQLDYEERAGQLVARAEVEAAAFHAGRRFRDALLALPRDLADELAAETDPRQAAALLEARLRETLDRTVSEIVPEPDGDGAGD